MAITLTHPRNQPEITHQGITSFQVQVPHKRNAENTAPVIKKNAVEIRYEVTTWDADGKAVARASRTVPAANWPAIFRQHMQSVYTMIQSDAESNGLIGAGDDEPI